MDALTAGLIGSIGTVILTKIIEYFLTNKQHRLTLKKEYFNRRLIVFEKAVAHWTITYQALGSMAMLFKTIRKEEVAAAGFEEVFSRLDMQLQTVSKETQEIGIAFALYTDMADHPGELGWIEKFFTLLGELNALAINLNNDYTMLNDPAWKTSEKEIQSYINDNERQLDDKIYDLEQMAIHVKDSYFRYIKQLRIEMKKYE